MMKLPFVLPSILGPLTTMGREDASKMSALRSTLFTVLVTIGAPAVLYFGILASLQAHAIYLHRVTLTWFKDLDVPEQFGFSHNQVTPFHIDTDDGVRLHAWHVPIGAYRRNIDDLLSHERGVDFTESLNFRLLRDDPEARLVLYFHGTSGTLASGWRPDSYRALYSGAPDKIHILTFDFRGYGLSTGTPTEPGIVQDAIAVFKWATTVAGIAPGRIVIFGQSLGSAVAVALADNLATQTPSVSCAGLVVTASFSDVATLTATYRIGGVIPVLSPVTAILPLFRYFTRHLQSTWRNQDRIRNFIQKVERYHIIHAEDDPDTPLSHTEALF